jgi:hypothetical protein
MVMIFPMPRSSRKNTIDRLRSRFYGSRLMMMLEIPHSNFWGTEFLSNYMERKIAERKYKVSLLE